MASPEFELIRDYFSDIGAAREDVLLGIGDDAALLRLGSGWELVVSSDTLVEGVHFDHHTTPEALGHKSLAVNLSDLAAMGAEPLWFTLALTLPTIDPVWLSAFTRGLQQLARATGVRLVGGDTTRGPLTITLQVMGRVPNNQAVRRSGAQIGDEIYVTGRLGDAALALRLRALGLPLEEQLAAALDRPQPRLATGYALRGRASAAIDLSDGLLADLGHILERGGAMHLRSAEESRSESNRLGADIELTRLPLSTSVRTAIDRWGWELALAAGDDYELCFTLPAGAERALRGHLDESEEITRIGQISATPGIRCIGPDGAIYAPQQAGFDHFAQQNSA